MLPAVKVSPSCPDEKEGRTEYLPPGSSLRKSFKKRCSLLISLLFHQMMGFFKTNHRITAAWMERPHRSSTEHDSSHSYAGLILIRFFFHRSPKNKIPCMSYHSIGGAQTFPIRLEEPEHDFTHFKKGEIIRPHCCERFTDLICGW